VAKTALCFIIIAYIFIITVVYILQYKRSCEFRAQMTYTRIYYIIIIYKIRFLLWARVYANNIMYTAPTGSMWYHLRRCCSSIRVTYSHRRIVRIYYIDNNLRFYVYLLYYYICITYIIVPTLRGELNKRPLCFAVGPWPARCFVPIYIYTLLLLLLFTHIDEKSDRKFSICIIIVVHSMAPGSE